jgi:hypothetical protein
MWRGWQQGVWRFGWLLMFLSLREDEKGREGAGARIVRGIAFQQQQQHDEGSSANSCLAKPEHFRRWIGWFL